MENGDGKSVNIWSDAWIPRNNTRRVLTRRWGSILQKAGDLVNPITTSWDEQLIWDSFWDEDAKYILSMPLFEDMEDFPAWHPDPKGMFSVKSAYALGVRLRDKEKGADASSSSTAACTFDWKRIWRLDMANKGKVFVWQFAHNSLQVHNNIARRGVKLDTRCPMCNRFDEDMGHIFFKCKDMRLC